MVAIVDFDVFRNHLGVEADDPQEADVERLYDAIGAEIRRITRRALEGEAATYDEILRLHGAREFQLRHVPVEAVTSINRVRFDATEDDPYEATQWRLEDAPTGRIRLADSLSPEYVRVIWTVTGEIPAQLPEAYLEWGKARWDDKDRPAALASYQTGDDAESYFASLAGKAPSPVMVVLVGLAHRTGGGPV